MEKHPIDDLMSTTMSKIRDMVDVNTIIGQPIQTQDITLIPVSKVSLGFASGGTDFVQKSNIQKNNFGGGSGAGIRIDPVAFIVIKDGHVRVISVEKSSDTAFDKVMEFAPDLINSVTSAFNKNPADKIIAEEEKQA